MAAEQVPLLFPGGENNAALGLLIPIGPQSLVSIVAGYCGLLSFIPPLAPFGLVLGIIGIYDLRKHRQKRGWGRAITGIVGSCLFSLMYWWLFYR